MDALLVYLVLLGGGAEGEMPWLERGASVGDLNAALAVANVPKNFRFGYTRGDEDGTRSV